MNSRRHFCVTIDDVFLDGYSTEEHLENILTFLDERDIAATFFVVPFKENGESIGDSPGYVRLLKRAVATGHEVAQHGVIHDRFEVGIPPKMVLDLPHEGPARNYLREHRDDIDRSHSIPNIREKLSRGRQALEDALGSAVTGFRGPALQLCDNLFVALAEEGYAYDSTVHFQDAAWDIINGLPHVPRPINRERFAAAQKAEGLLELPLTGEYTWYLGNENFDQCLALAKHDFDGCSECDIPFVPICHVSPVQEGDGNRGFELYERLLDHANEQANKRNLELKFVTLSETAETLDARPQAT